MGKSFPVLRRCNTIGYVLRHGHVFEQRIILKHHADVPLLGRQMVTLSHIRPKPVAVSDTALL